jgi:hypothetical protein
MGLACACRIRNDAKRSAKLPPPEKPSSRCVRGSKHCKTRFTATAKVPFTKLGVSWELSSGKDKIAARRPTSCASAYIDAGPLPRAIFCIYQEIGATQPCLQRFISFAMRKASTT